MIPLELDHLFICVRRDAPEAEHLRQIGLREGRRRTHQGQGTANVCFFFQNAMLELIWVSDEEEVQSPLVRPTRLWDRWRWRETGSCPFGFCFRPIGESRVPLPFSTWDYTPPYLREGLSLPIAVNSERSQEPLLFVSWLGKRPDAYPEDQRPPTNHRIGCREVTSLHVTLPLRESPSPELQTVRDLGLISVQTGNEYGVDISFDDRQAHQEADLAPELPLHLRW